MPKFPVDASKAKVVRALERVGFRVVRERGHIAMSRQNADEHYAVDAPKSRRD